MNVRNEETEKDSTSNSNELIENEWQIIISK